MKGMFCIVMAMTGGYAKKNQAVFTGIGRLPVGKIADGVQ